MEYLCLAAGKGTRFGRLGTYLQKCMYPVGLKPFLEYSLAALRRSSSLEPANDRVHLIVGHHGEQVRRYFGSSYEGLSLGYLEQNQVLGTGHALHLAYEALNPSSPVVAWLADAYVPRERFDRVRTHNERNVQTVGPGEAGEKEDLKVTLRGGLVERAWQGEQPLYDVGVWKLEPEVLALMTLERRGEYRMVPNLQLALERGYRVGALVVDEWLHLGGTLPTPEANVLSVARRVLELDREAA